MQFNTVPSEDEEIFRATELLVSPIMVTVSEFNVCQNN